MFTFIGLDLFLVLYTIGLALTFKIIDKTRKHE